jgi:secreted PhoX family phosphatase
VKRKSVGGLAFEGNPILADGTMYYGDELRPGGGNPGGGIYKFVPDFPYGGAGPITVPAQSPLASGRIYGLKVGSAGDNGQGTEIGQGAWVEVTAATFADVNGNVNLRAAQAALKFTGYYRPEDMEFDPVALARGDLRACWTNTGRMSNGGGSAVETGSIYGEVMCLTDASAPLAVGGAVPTVRRFLAGDPAANYFDNLAFQPRTGNLVVLEDGEVEVVKGDGTKELRGNDIWMCLPDGADRDVQSDGCIRIVSLRDTTAEPSGFIFTASGEDAYVNIQHRGVNTGALLKISGFHIPEQ